MPSSAPDPSSFFPVANHTTSFWRANPHALDTFQSSEAVPAECDIAIIGSGLAGVSTAYHILSRPGPRPKVVILDAREACSGATGRNGGHSKISPLSLKMLEARFGAETAAELKRLQLAQLQAMKAVVEKEEIDCDFFVTRSFDILFQDDHAAEVKAWLKQRHEQGVEWLRDVQWLDGPHLEKVTGVNGVKGATSCPAAGIWPYKFVTGLLARCLELGASLYTQTAVTSTRRTGSVTELVTARGVCRASKVVYATNGYAASLLPSFAGAITPIRGSACHIAVPGGTTTEAVAEPPHLTFTYNLHYTSSQVDYLVPRLDGSIILGGGSNTFRHDRAQWYDTVDDAGLIDSVRTHFADVMPHYFRGWDVPGVEVDHLWTGIMGYTLDGMPHVGAVPGTTNEWLLAGFNGGGMATIFTTARAVAKMVTEGIDFQATGLPACFETTQARMENRVDIRGS